MTGEIRGFVTRRAEVREDEAGSSANESTMRVSRHSRPSGPVKRRLQALERASNCNHPAADIDRMLADIARGRDLRSRSDEWKCTQTRPD